MTVQHVVLSGGDFDVGAALAEVAQQDSAWRPVSAQDPTRNRARRRWFERHWPQQYLRMAGVAAAFGEHVENDRLDFSYVMAEPLSAQCSAVWCSPGVSADGHARVGRNLDFTTQTVSELFGQPRKSGELAVFARPYVIETHPDSGRANFVTTMGDLLGCLDGMNADGLVVALLADDESPVRQPSGTPQAGLCETQLARFLLDTCSSTADALDALYSTKQYDEWAVAHYLVADASGAFVWERELHNVEHAIPAEAGALCVTNYLLCHGSPGTAPDDGANTDVNDAYRRSRTLLKGTDQNTLHPSALWDLLEDVRKERRHDPSQPGDRRVRTLWHNQFDIEARTAEYEFYLGDEADGSPRRSPRVTTSLSAWAMD
jgi:Acyl-coenzyme A:6-aminopenicillanic acid acyl-transferase